MEELTEESLNILRSAHPEIEADRPADWLSELGGVIASIPYRWLFWPDVHEVFGAAVVDLHGYGRKEIERRLISARSSGGEWIDVVDSFNYFEVSQIFRMWEGSLVNEERTEILFARLLVEPWTARLSQVFPGRTFRVSPKAPEFEIGVCLEVRQANPVLRPPDWWSQGE
ncbi:hypothetical protein GCM10027160_24510 [Streptomyces calidiresistens]|uniref:Uncharacterized protein n=1 Tax=Streptomyces calidiresistens TaxID=1485586 RepID=A0A7W3T7E6_9ACTN|nr:hypothetical protein [Streptomyces calidiresistens]MBB0232302.1 hypothetical protein [Streptomyces calidiresistens]